MAQEEVTQEHGPESDVRLAQAQEAERRREETQAAVERQQIDRKREADRKRARVFEEETAARRQAADQAEKQRKMADRSQQTAEKSAQKQQENEQKRVRVAQSAQARQERSAAQQAAQQRMFARRRDLAVNSGSQLDLTRQKSAQTTVPKLAVPFALHLKRTTNARETEIQSRIEQRSDRIKNRRAQNEALEQDRLLLRQAREAAFQQLLLVLKENEKVRELYQTLSEAEALLAHSLKTDSAVNTRVISLMNTAMALDLDERIKSRVLVGSSERLRSVYFQNTPSGPSSTSESDYAVNMEEMRRYMNRVWHFLRFVRKKEEEQTYEALKSGQTVQSTIHSAHRKNPPNQPHVSGVMNALKRLVGVKEERLQEVAVEETVAAVPQEGSDTETATKLPPITAANPSESAQKTSEKPQAPSTVDKSDTTKKPDKPKTSETPQKTETQEKPETQVPEVPEEAGTTPEDLPREPADSDYDSAADGMVNEMQSRSTAELMRLIFAGIYPQVFDGPAGDNVYLDNYPAVSSLGRAAVAALCERANARAGGRGSCRI